MTVQESIRFAQETSLKERKYQYWNLTCQKKLQEFHIISVDIQNDTYGEGFRPILVQLLL